MPRNGQMLLQMMHRLFIRSDFRLKDSKDYYGLAPEKSVLLRFVFLQLHSMFRHSLMALKYAYSRYNYAFPIKCKYVKFGVDNETVCEIHAEYDPSKKSKTKGRSALGFRTFTRS